MSEMPRKHNSSLPESYRAEVRAGDNRAPASSSPPASSKSERGEARAKDSEAYRGTVSNLNLLRDRDFSNVSFRRRA